MIAILILVVVITVTMVFINLLKRSSTYDVVWLRSTPGSCSFTCDYSQLWGPDVDAEYIMDILSSEHTLKFRFTSVNTAYELLGASQNVDILAYSSNVHSYDSVLKVIEKKRPRVLIHLSDEWGKRPEYTRLFSQVPLVYRQYRFESYPQLENVRTLPVGYHCWDASYTQSPAPVSKRKYVWCFMGSIKGEREKMITIFKELDLPHFNESTRGLEENRIVFNNSIFTLCPHGNVNVESSRPYAATANGSIPLLLCTNDEWNETYEHFDITPPWLRGSSWHELGSRVKNLLSQRDALQKLQDDCLGWWNAHKLAIRANIINVLKDKIQ